jgi:hypothetical protein
LSGNGNPIRAILRGGAAGWTGSVTGPLPSVTGRGGGRALRERSGRRDDFRRVAAFIPIMKKHPICGLIAAAVLLAAPIAARAQVIEFRASLTAAQEVPVTTSTATGSAIVLYDLRANTFDLFVSASGFTNTLADAHIHEGAAGVVAPALIHFPVGSFVRTGNNLSATFLRQAYTGDRLKFLQNGAYVNLHSPQFPGGEIRGQLIAQPKRLVSVIDVAQEQAAFPNVNLAGGNLSDFGAAVMSYNPGTNRISLRVSVYNFRNTLSNSHYHEGAPAVSGPVVVNLGNNANAGGYTSANGHISGSFDIPYTGDPIRLLTGGAYLNFHSTTFTGGEARGQVRATDEVPGTRMFSTATRGFVGAGNQNLITGISIVGPDPVRMLITAKSPSLTAFGVTGALADPVLDLYDAAGRQIAVSDNVGTPAAGSDLAALRGAPTNAAESALLVVLPPGNYTAVVSGNGGTGVALLEATDLRIVGATAAVASADADMPGLATETRTLAEARLANLEFCATPAASVQR